ncbi:pyridoxal phosphate-dependent decarboxylase family protein [Nocardiopsis suaedae]|uniref:Aminotransferase class V-fold PLP-dependent enzyme n=1 Tax=Nocardiopsis suaedae TaxID=3018444 RepID=A0ABT4TMM3_9ACTN|nr:aminotransferase class I/II-fold pyridoxal phosphate-dependent enzyme [Nocardiopsis suaedae]MDA2805942.1 aminotransferase class V-fold PLP-dependent enzyme [Nocardiopsis suaedae]
MNELPHPAPLATGPAAAEQLGGYLSTAVREMSRWMAEFGPYRPHASLQVDETSFRAALDDLLGRLRDNYPFFHPRYAGQMLKPPHPAAVIGYVAAMTVNPNNHALDGGPATARMEREAVAQLATMFGYDDHLGHLTSSGTIANLEALFVARESHPGKGIAFSADAHYTHGRMCHLLGVPAHPVATDDRGRIDLDALEEVLRTGTIGTVVLTTGTTGLGAVDPVHEALALCSRYGTRIHVDAAYGGFFRLIADDTAEGVASAPFTAIADCDSVVVDPHKHGLQPYGCGAVLFKDPDVMRFYRHDSPYTYFTSDQLHLGEISLECSRSGAAAAALWLTFQVLPPTPEALGAVLRPGRRAALRWASLLGESAEYALYQEPELDIVTYLPRRRRLSEVDRVSAHVLETGMALPPDEAVFVATYDVSAAELAGRGHPVTADADRGRILRSVLMKPESEAHVSLLLPRLEKLAAAAH